MMSSRLVLLPIDTIPKDGTYVLVFGDSGYIGTPLRAEICKYDAEWRPKNPIVNHAGDAFTDGGAEAKYWFPLSGFVTDDEYVLYAEFGELRAIVMKGNVNELLKKMHTEEMCWADDGLRYFITTDRRTVHKPYDDLCKMVMK